jgi:DNA-binding CsgD family transcriptional regulator
VRLGRCWGDGPTIDVVSSDSESRLSAAQQALEAGEWSSARSLFEAALEEEETPEALLGLGNALWWLDEAEASFRCRARAYAGFRERAHFGVRRGRNAFQAAVVALQLAMHYGGNLGNVVAAQGWLGRAARLVEEFELSPLQGWVVLGRAAAAVSGGNPRAGEGLARQARDLGRRFGDADLELCALSQLGGALVLMGRVEEGASLLDEAMAGALGEGGPETVVLTSCVTFICCSRAAELKRAAQWIRAAEEFNGRYGSAHLYAMCRIHYANVLFATGEWAGAEAELLAALDRISATAEHLVRGDALSALAHLRLAQGRIEEAARLLEGLEDHGPAAQVLAAVRLARGELELATSLLRRRLREVSEDRLESAPLLELLAEAEIAQGATQTAMDRARELAELGTRLSCDVIVARGERALGRTLAAAGEGAEAVPHLERALEAFGRLELPFETSRTRLLLAQAMVGEEREAAIAEARTALASFEKLGAARDADAAAAYLRSLGVKAARSGPRGLGALTKREAEVLGLLAEGLSNREIAERLFVTRKTVENHVARVLSKLDLSGRAEAAAYAVRHGHGRSPASTRRSA